MTNDILNILIFVFAIQFLNKLGKLFFIDTRMSIILTIFRNNYIQFLRCCHQKRKLNPIAESFIEHETVATNEKS